MSSSDNILKRYIDRTSINIDEKNDQVRDNNLDDDIEDGVSAMIMCSERFEQMNEESEQGVPFRSTFELLEKHHSADDIKDFFNRLYHFLDFESSSPRLSSKKWRISSILYFINVIANKYRQEDPKLDALLCEINDKLMEEHGVYNWIHENGGWIKALSTEHLNPRSQTDKYNVRCPFLRRLGCIGRIISKHSTSLYVATLLTATVATVIVALG